MNEASTEALEELLGKPEKRIPYSGMLELTRLCSLKCTHCYLGDARWQRDADELSTAEAKTVMDVLAAEGTLWLFITGGEPLIRRDFREIWRYGVEKGFLLTLFTNATLIDAAMADFLAENPPLKIEISIYGATKATYERVTLIPGSYERFLRGVEFLREKKLPCELKTVLLKENFYEVDDMRAMAREWGMVLSTDGAIQASTGEGKTSGLAPCASRAPLERVVEIELADKYYRKDMTRNFHQKSENAQAGMLFGCGAGKDSFYVSSRGYLQMCSATTYRGESLRKNPSMAGAFKQAWKNFGEIRKIKMDPKSPCQSCDIAYLCQNCPAYAFLETGNEQAPVEWLCQLTHSKARALNLPHVCRPDHFCRPEPAALRASEFGDPGRN